MSLLRRRAAKRAAAHTEVNLPDWARAHPAVWRSLPEHMRKLATGELSVLDVVKFVEPDWTPELIEQTGHQTYAEHRKAQDDEARKSADFHRRRVDARHGRSTSPSDTPERE